MPLNRRKLFWERMEELSAREIARAVVREYDCPSCRNDTLVALVKLHSFIARRWDAATRAARVN